MTPGIGNFRNPENDAAIAAAVRGDYSLIESQNAVRREQVEGDLAELQQIAEQHAARYADPRIGRQFLDSAAHTERLVREALNRDTPPNR